MARQVQAISKHQKKVGVIYYPDVVDRDEDGEIIWDNQGTWRRYCELMDSKDPLSESEAAECVALEAKVKELFWIRLIPMTHNEFQEERAQSRMSQLMAQPDEKDASLKLVLDPLGMTENFACEMVAKKGPECGGYNGFTLEPVLDHGKSTFDAAGDEAFERIDVWPTTGQDLVDFIRAECWKTERRVIDDTYKALSSSSHLKRGLKKKWLSRPVSSSRGTGHLAGGVHVVGEKVTNTTTMVQLKPSSV